MTLEIKGKTVRLSGSIDRVDRLPDGSISIIDYKTGKPKYYRDHLETKLQPYLYSQAAKKLDAELNVRNAGYLFLKDSAYYLQAWRESGTEDKEANRIASLLDWISDESAVLEDTPDFQFEEDGRICSLGSKAGNTENCSKFCDYLELCTALRDIRDAAEAEVTENE